MGVNVLALIPRLLQSGARVTRVVMASRRLAALRKAKKALDRFDGATTPQGVRIYVDEERLRTSIGKSLDRLDKFYAYSKAEVFMEMKKEMGSFAGYCALNTPPLDAGGLEVGERRMEDSIHSMFIPLHAIRFASLVLAKNWSLVEAYGYEFKSKRYNEYLKNKQWDKIYKVFTNPNLIVSQKMGKPVPYEGNGQLVKTVNEHLHRRALDPKTMMRKQDITYLVAGKDAKQKIQAFVIEMKKRVGKMASGWIICYRKLQGKGKDLPFRMVNATAGKVHVDENLERGKSMKIGISNQYGNTNNWMSEPKGEECETELTGPICARLTKHAVSVFQRNKMKYLQ